MHNHDRPLIKYDIATHSRRLAMSQKVGMIGKLREDEVASACNPFINLLHTKSFIGQFHCFVILED